MRQGNEIEEERPKYLSFHLLVAANLHFLITVLKINNDLECIDQHVVNIAQPVFTSKNMS